METEVKKLNINTNQITEINSLENKNIRFDIFEVYIHGKENVINHIKNVFF